MSASMSSTASAALQVAAVLVIGMTAAPGFASDSDAASATTRAWVFYVSPDGDDAAAGTEASPLRTLQAARDKVRPITAPYHAARAAYEEVAKEVFDARSKVGTRRLEAWDLFGKGNDGEAKRVLDGVNGDDKTFRNGEHEARKRFDAAKGDAFGTVHIKLLPGRYALRTTFVVGMEDSGYEGLDVVYEGADPSHPPVICADTPLAGWRKAGDVPHMSPQAAGKLWVADLPANLGRIRSLYDGDTRLTESAESFDTDSSIGGNGGDIFRYDLVDVFVYPPGKMREYENLSDIELAIYPRQRWMHAIMQFESIDTRRHHARTTRRLGCGMTRCPGRKNAATLLNTIDYLDEPGEWCVNTVTRKVYYWPAGEAPSREINAPALRELIRVEGDIDLQGLKDRPVTNVHFRNLLLTKADRSVIGKNDGLAHSEFAVYDAGNAALRFRGAAYCTVDNVTVANTAGNGVRMDLYAQYLTVANSKIHDTGNAGVVILGYGPGRKDVNCYNKVVNCEIHDVGLIHRLGHGVFLAQTHDSIISHCKIYNTPMNGISITGMRYWSDPHNGRHPEYLPVRWQDLPPRAKERVFRENRRLDAVGQEPWASVSPEKFDADAIRRYETDTDWFDYERYIHTRNNRVEYCDISNTSYDLGDSNAIYIHTSNEGNAAYYNCVHGLTNKDSGAAMRTDNVQRHAIFSHNIIQNSATHGGFSVSYDTIVRNNYIIDTGRSVYAHQGPWPNTSLIEKNICYFGPRDQETWHRIRSLAVHLAKGHEAWKLRTMRPDWNLFYSTAYKEKDVASFGKTPGTIMGPNSLYADPQFEDLTTFRLKDTSPAHAMGIEQLDITRMGLLAKPFRISYR